MKGKYPTQSAEDIDSVLAMMIRYQRAAFEGSVRLNLRLMARVFAGIVQARPLIADEFQSWADVLQGLRRLELIAISEVHRYTTDNHASQPSNDWGKNSEDFVSQLVPKPFASEAQFLAVCQASSRTGLIMTQGDMNLFRYASTPLMDELAKLSEFQDIVRQAHYKPTHTSCSD